MSSATSKDNQFIISSPKCTVPSGIPLPANCIITLPSTKTRHGKGINKAIIILIVLVGFTTLLVAIVGLYILRNRKRVMIAGQAAAQSARERRERQEEIRRMRRGEGVVVDGDGDGVEVAAPPYSKDLNPEYDAALVDVHEASMMGANLGEEAGRADDDGQLPEYGAVEQSV